MTQEPNNETDTKWDSRTTFFFPSTVISDAPRTSIVNTRGEEYFQAQWDITNIDRKKKTLNQCIEP